MFLFTILLSQKLWRAITLSTPPFAHRKFFISIIFTMRFIMDKGRGKGFVAKICSRFALQILDKALYFFSSAFLPEPTVLRLLPRRVREFDLVLWPCTGKPLMCRMPL